MGNGKGYYQLCRSIPKGERGNNMRTEERWSEVIQSKIIDRLFPARLAKDLKDLKLKPLHNEGSYFIYSGRKATGKTVMACRILLGYEFNDYIKSEFRTTKFLTVTDFS